MSLPEADWTSGFPFESNVFCKEFYLGTVLDGYLGGRTVEASTVLADAINRGVELSTNDDVWGVYQVANIDQDASTFRDRIVALIFKGEVYLREPNNCKPESLTVNQLLAELPTIEEEDC